jgi:hypothetical protein
MTDNPTLCIYHAHCQDGFAAAWIVHRRFGDGVKFVSAGRHPKAAGFRVPLGWEGDRAIDG